MDIFALSTDMPFGETSSPVTVSLLVNQQVFIIVNVTTHDGASDCVARLEATRDGNSWFPLANLFGTAPGVHAGGDETERFGVTAVTDMPTSSVRVFTSINQQSAEITVELAAV